MGAVPATATATARPSSREKTTARRLRSSERSTAKGERPRGRGAEPMLGETALRFQHSTNKKQNKRHVRIAGNVLCVCALYVCMCVREREMRERPCSSCDCEFFLRMLAKSSGFFSAAGVAVGPGKRGLEAGGTADGGAREEDAATTPAEGAGEGSGAAEGTLRIGGWPEPEPGLPLPGPEALDEAESGVGDCEGRRGWEGWTGGSD